MIQFILSSIAAIFIVMDPLGGIPVLLAVTQGDSKEKRNAVVKKACLTACVILLAFALLGGLIFKIFGITLAAFRIAGGILLLKIAMDMLYARRLETHITTKEEKEAIEKEDVAVVPLAMPMLSGPATIATVLVLMEQSKSWYQTSVVVGSIFIVSLATYFILRGSNWLFDKLKETGVKILVRVMGLILLAIAVQFILDGIQEVFFKKL